MLKLIHVSCRWCNIGFCVCRCCWRGQAYCGDACRNAGRRAPQSKAQQRYRQTEKGKKSHRLSENRRRHRKTDPPSKNMDDATTRTPFDWAMLASRKENGVGFCPDRQDRCQFCNRIGEIVSHFPRRGYG